MRQLLETLQARALVGLGEHHVETEQGDFLAIEQFVNQAGEFVAAPGPTTDFGKAFLVDVDNHDPVIQRARHGGAQTAVVNDVVQALQDPDG